MSFTDLLADLPPAMENEPSTLRQDIADELADHLACALHRELVKSGDEDTARARVLERFGDPRRIARQLWWQAMWSRVMLQRISIALQAVLSIALIAIIGMLWHTLSQVQGKWAVFQQQAHQNQQMLAQIAEQLRHVELPRKLAPAYGGMPGGEGDFSAGGMMSAAGSAPSPAAAIPDGASTLSLTLVMESDQPPAQPTPLSLEPAANCLVALLNDDGRALTLSFGSPMAGMGMEAGSSSMMGMGGMGFALPGGLTANLQTFADGRAATYLPAEAGGRIDVGQVDPGRYLLIVEFPNGWFTHHKIIVRPGEKRAERIVCPRPVEKAFATLTMPPVPGDLRQQNVRLFARIVPAPQQTGRVTWQLMNAKRIDALFDPETGELDFASETAIGIGSSHRISDYRGDEERFLVLPVGMYDVRLAAFQIDDQPRLDQLDKLLPPDLDLENSPSSVATFPPESSDRSVRITVEAGQNTIQLSVDEIAGELFEPARIALAARRTQSQQPNQPPSPVRTSGPQITTLQVQLLGSTPDTAPTSGSVQIEGEDLLNQSIKGKKTFSDGKAVLDFGELLPGAYTLTVISDGIFKSQFPFKAARGEQNVLDIRCPPVKEKVSMAVKANLPQDLRESRLWTQLEYVAVPFDFEGRTWEPRSGGTMTLTDTGEALSAFSSRTLSDREMSAGRYSPREQSQVVWNTIFRSPERLAEAREQSQQPLWLSGVKYQLQQVVIASDPQTQGRLSSFGGRGRGDRTVYAALHRDSEDWPESLNEVFELSAGKTWTVTLPDELLNAAREQLKAAGSNPERDGALPDAATKPGTPP